MKPSVSFAIFALAASSFSQVPGEPQFEGPLGPLSYSGGYILSWNSPEYTRITIYGPGTKLLYSAELRENQHLKYGVWAIDSDGIAARAYTISDGHREEGRIDLLDLAGKPINTIKTALFAPQALAFAPDHTIWTTGFDVNYEREYKDFNVLHHYSRDGQEIGQALPWSQIARDYNAETSLQRGMGGNFLFATKDRVGFWSHLDDGHSTWIELSPAGVLLGKYHLGNYRVLCYEPMAISASGAVYARIYREDRFDGWAVLDRIKGEWHKLSGYPKGTLIGSDEDNLLFSQHKDGWTVIHSVASSSLKLAPDEPQAAAASQQE
jgi:hypothetical protein